MGTTLEEVVESGRQLARFQSDGDQASSVLYEVESGRRFVVWAGARRWLRRVETVYDEAQLNRFDAASRLVDVCDDAEPPRALLDCSGSRVEPFEPWKWRNLDGVRCVDALRGLARVVSAVHRAGYTFGGLHRSELLIDAQTGTLVVGAAPGLARSDSDPETLWRDIRLFARLAYENFLETEYPGGHKLVELLQDRDALAETGIIVPGLSQLLAGCVTPYGDLAYEGADELLDGLDNLASELASPVRFEVGARSTQGTHIFRQNNQDSCAQVVVETIRGSKRLQVGFFCVADGIGGIEDGERASALAVETACAAFWRAWRNYDVETLQAHPVAFGRAIAKITSQRLALEGDFAPEGNRGGTTFTGALVVGHRAGICHVGDSHAALVRGSRSIPLTREHTLATILEQLNESGAVGEETSQRTISRFFSTGTEVEHRRIDGIGAVAGDELDLSARQRQDRGFELHTGDLLLLTTDGAHTELSSARLQQLLALHRDAPQKLCDAVVDEAITNIGRDNATALAVLVN